MRWSFLGGEGKGWEGGGSGGGRRRKGCVEAKHFHKRTLSSADDWRRVHRVMVSFWGRLDRLEGVREGEWRRKLDSHVLLQWSAGENSHLHRFSHLVKPLEKNLSPRVCIEIVRQVTTGRFSLKEWQNMKSRTKGFSLRRKCLGEFETTYLRVAMADKEEQPGPGDRYVACFMTLPRVFHSHSEVMGPARQEVSV